MIRTVPIPQSAAWTPSADEVNSFDGGKYQPCKLVGPAHLVRLLCHGGQAPEGQHYGPNKKEGTFWFDEADLARIRSDAEKDLKSQARPGDSKQKLESRVQMYMRHQFRDLLAVRRDWTPSFDYVAVLSIPLDQAVIALAGPVAGQPVYSDTFPGGAGARKAGLRLKGGLMQYIIRFDFPANHKARHWIDPGVKSF